MPSQNTSRRPQKKKVTKKQINNNKPPTQNQWKTLIQPLCNMLKSNRKKSKQIWILSDCKISRKRLSYIDVAHIGNWYLCHLKWILSKYHYFGMSLPYPCCLYPYIYFLPLTSVRISAGTPVAIRIVHSCCNSPQWNIAFWQLLVAPGGFVGDTSTRTS